MRGKKQNILVYLALGLCLVGAGCVGIVGTSTTPPVMPSITAQPLSQSVTAGQTASFSVTATGTAPLSYQWHKNGATIGANSASYTTPPTTTADNGAVFGVMVSDSAGNVMSNGATLTVNPAPVAPSISTQPASATVTTGQAATFSVTASGTAPLSYQWQKNGTVIGGATGASYTTPATTTTENGSTFKVVVSNSAGSVTSNSATLTVNPALVAPNITTQPASVMVTAGQTATFSVVASGTAPLSYQWHKNGTAVSGATGASYTTPTTSSSDNGSTFAVVVSNSVGNVTSATATLTVNVPPSISTQPTNQTVTAGQTATFGIAAGGTAPLSYQWQKNGGNIGGATSASYTTPATTTTDNGATFRVAVSNLAGNITSSAATLTVNADTTPPTVSITLPQANATVSGTITVTASASDNVGIASVQLRVDGTNVGAANTTSPYTFSLDTTTLSNASHNLTAVATDTSGNQTTSAAVAITVSNQNGGTPASANNGAGCPISNDAQHLFDMVTSYPCYLPNPTGQGNLLVIWLRYHTPAQTPTFSDNVGGNVYTLATSVVDGTHSTVSALYYVPNVKAGVTKVKVAFSPAVQYVQMQPYEFFNVSTTSPLDQAIGQAGSGTSVSSGALDALTATGDLVVHFGIVDGVTPIRSCAPASQSNIAWMLRETMVADNYPSCLQYGVYNSNASFSPTFSVNTSVSYVSIAAAFKAASAGTPPPSGIRVAYVQHDDTQNEQANSIPLQYPISGNLIAMLFTSGCNNGSATDCAYATAVSDSANTYIQVGGAPIIIGGDSGQAWYARNVLAGTYSPTYTMHPRSVGGNGNSFILYDIVGASVDPLDTGFGRNGIASITFTQSTGGSGGPITTFTATPSHPNEVVLSTIGADWDSFTGITSPAGAQFLSCNYTSETNPSHCDLNGGWGLYYNGASTAAETWTWTHDSSNFAGAGNGIALGVAFVPGVP